MEIGEPKRKEKHLLCAQVRKKHMVEHINVSELPQCNSHLRKERHPDTRGGK